MYVNMYVWKAVCLAKTSPVVRLLFILDVQELIRHRSVPSEYERCTPSDGPQRNKICDLLQNGCNDFDYILVIYGDHLSELPVTVTERSKA
jgi:hypothetical protein